MENPTFTAERVYIVGANEADNLYVDSEIEGVIRLLNLCNDRPASITMTIEVAKNLRDRLNKLLKDV